MRKIFTFFFIFYVFSYGEEIYIAAAAGYKAPVSEIIENYKKEKGLDVNCIFGNMKQISTYVETSNKISMIIGDGDFLDKLGINYEVKKTLGEGRLVLIYKNFEISQVKDLLKDEVKSICIPDYKKAIYGKAAVECLKYYGIYEKIEDKLIVVKTVPQVSAYMLQDEVDVGLVNLTDYIKMKDRGINKYDIDINSYAKINIELRLIDEKGEELYKYFDSDNSKEILLKYGL